MKYTKKSLFMSLVSLLLCFSMLLGTTYAWFTDTVSSAGNVIQSGTLDVDLVDKDGNSMEGEVIKFVTADNREQNKILWEPGCTYKMEPVYVVNKGNLALKYQIVINGVEGSAKLLEAIEWTVTVGDDEMDLDDLNGELLAGAKSEAIVLSGHMKEEAGNEYQGLTADGISIAVYATQYTSESDSFDNQYDKDATFEDFADTSILATETKTLATGADSIQFDLYNNGVSLAKVIVPASAIADTAKSVTVTFDGIEPSAAAIIDENTKAYAYDIKVTNLKANLTGDQLVTVVVSAPNALAAMKAYHNGTLIENAVYDEVEGTITFKTASFSPYDFTSQIEEVSDLAGLREALQKDGTTAQLIKDIVIDLKEGSADRSEDHKTLSTNGKSMWYNGINIKGKNVGLDLNGHSITVKCYEKDNYDGYSNEDVGALFFVDTEGSLNITDTADGGFIKMASSIYAVWAPYDDPSYMDIYGGAFIADSYADDPIGTPPPADDNPLDDKMQYENSNRALIYAGTGGHMNIYGGYFLYNNTPNDFLNRNNGAFNCTNWYEGPNPYITIHEGVMLIDKGYKQDPTYTSTPHGSFDEYSIKLAKDCEIAEISKSITIDGNTYSTWYQVVADITSITAKAKQGVYDVNYEFDGDDFNVYAITKNGASGKITNFDVTVDKTTGIATITYISDSGNTLQTICSISQMNLTLLDENRIRLPIKDPNSDITAPFFSTGNFSVSGWAWLINGAYTYDYFANNNLTYTAPNGELVTGFNNTYGEWGNTYWGNFVEGKYSEGYYGLTIDNAKPYTTLGINCVVGCLDDAPALKGFGVYINDDLSTLKWTAPAAVYPEGNDMYNHYGWNNGHSVLEINCADFEAGKTYEVHWVLVFEDGVTPLCDWTVTMAEASASDAVFTDTDKPNANVIIMSGQSNMFGPAPLTQEIIDNYANVDYSNVFIKYANINFDVAADGSIPGSLSTVFSNSDFQQYEVGIGAQGNTYFGPELALAYTLATNEAFAGQQWYIIKYAAAGTALGSQWTSNCSIDGKTTTLTNDMLDYVQTAIDSLSDDFDVHIRSFMWMQGESDAATSASASNYENLEKTLVSRVRDTFAAYATRPIGSVPGSGISFIDAGIADNEIGKNTAEGGPNDWVYASGVNEGKVNNSQYWCSLPAMNYENCTPTSGPLSGVQFQVGAPSQLNPLGGNIVNSIFIDTHHLLSKAAAHSLDPNHALYEDYGNDSDNKDWAHYSAGSMEGLGQLFGSCLMYMIMQNG